MYDYKRFVPTDDSILRRKINNSKRFALAYTIICDFKLNGKSFIRVCDLSREMKKSIAESYQILKEFSNLGYLENKKTVSKSLIFLIKDYIVSDELLKIAERTMQSEDARR